MFTFVSQNETKTSAVAIATKISDEWRKIEATLFNRKEMMKLHLFSIFFFAIFFSKKSRDTRFTYPPLPYIIFYDIFYEKIVRSMKKIFHQASFYSFIWCWTLKIWQTKFPFQCSLNTYKVCIANLYVLISVDILCFNQISVLW